MNNRNNLGRGLSALLGDDEIDFNDIEAVVNTKESRGGIRQMEISQINIGKYQPRTEFDKEALQELANNIKQHGILQPLLIRKTIDGYELIAGERRLRAAKIAGLAQVPIIEKNFTDEETLEVALVENLLRENLSPIEEAEGFQRLIDEFARTQETVSQMVGKSRSHVTNMLRLLSLPEGVKALIKENKLSAGHAKVLVGLGNAENLAKQIIAKDLSVRAVENLVSKLKGKKNTETKEKNYDIIDLEKELKKSLGVKIKISPNPKGGGKLIMHYHSVAELDAIIDMLENKRN